MKIESLTMHIFFLQILIRSSEVGRDENELPICIKTFYFVAEFSIKKCDSLLKKCEGGTGALYMEFAWIFSSSKLLEKILSLVIRSTLVIDLRPNSIFPPM